MKNVISLLLIVCVCLFSGCADTPQKEGDSLPEQNLPSVSEEQTGSVDEGGEEVYLIINGNALKVTLAENSSVSALMELLRENDISYTANDYGGFEKVGSLGFSLPRNDMRITAEPGDVILCIRAIRSFCFTAAIAGRTQGSGRSRDILGRSFGSCCARAKGA